MRVWEFLGEHRAPPSPPVTLRALHKMKLEAQAKTREEQERYALMPLMYGNADRWQTGDQSTCMPAIGP